MDLRPLASYVRELRPAMPPEVFKPARSRLLWLPVHLAIIGGLAYAIAGGHVPWPLVPLLSLVIGVSFGGLTFLAHETLHGGVIRNGTLRRVVGWIGFSSFMVSPRLWIGWHNRMHHGNANKDQVDPDMYPTLATYRLSSTTQTITDKFSLGGSRISGLLSVFFGFTGQSKHMLLTAQRRGLLSARDAKLAYLETALAVVMWAIVLVLVGPLAFIFVYLLPLIVANGIVMAYILTNHGLSPLTDVNDPLVNSLTVTVPRGVEWLTLGFGFHTEHHLFPAMSTRHAPVLRAILLARYPDRYQSMPLSQALLALHRTARVYRDDTTLIDPTTGHTYPTLLPAPPPPPAPEELDEPEQLRMAS